MTSKAGKIPVDENRPVCNHQSVNGKKRSSTIAKCVSGLGLNLVSYFRCMISSSSCITSDLHLLYTIVGRPFFMSRSAYVRLHRPSTTPGTLLSTLSHEVLYYSYNSLFHTHFIIYNIYTRTSTYDVNYYRKLS